MKKRVSLRKAAKIVLGKGESEAIVLSKELKADLLLIDEAPGREIAKRFGIPIKGILEFCCRLNKVV